MWSLLHFLKGSLKRSLIALLSVLRVHVSNRVFTQRLSPSVLSPVWGPGHEHGLRVRPRGRS